MQDCIVLSNRLILKCSIRHGKYVPEEILSINQLLRTIEEASRNISPKFQWRKISDGISAARHNKSFRKRKASLPTSVSRRKSDSIILEIDDKDSSEDMNKIHCNTKRKFSVGSIVDSAPENNYKRLVDWMKSGNSEYVSMETLKSSAEVRTLINTILQVDKPFILKIRGNKDGSFTTTCDLMETFTRDFMVVPITNRHCLFMEPF